MVSPVGAMSNHIPLKYRSPSKINYQIRHIYLTSQGTTKLRDPLMRTILDIVFSVTKYICLSQY